MVIVVLQRYLPLWVMAIHAAGFDGTTLLQKANLKLCEQCDL